MDLAMLKSSMTKIFRCFEEYKLQQPLNNSKYFFVFVFCDYYMNNLVATSLCGNKIQYKCLQ